MALSVPAPDPGKAFLASAPKTAARATVLPGKFSEARQRAAKGAPVQPVGLGPRAAARAKGLEESQAWLDSPDS